MPAVPASIVADEFSVTFWVLSAFSMSPSMPLPPEVMVLLPDGLRLMPPRPKSKMSMPSPAAKIFTPAARVMLALPVLTTVPPAPSSIWARMPVSPTALPAPVAPMSSPTLMLMLDAPAPV